MCSVATKASPKQVLARDPWASVSIQWRWAKRPDRTAGGWRHGAILLAGAAYTANVTFDALATIIDFGKALTGDIYRVTVRPGEAACDCADATFRGRVCKHATCAVELLADLGGYDDYDAGLGITPDEFAVLAGVVGEAPDEAQDIAVAMTAYRPTDMRRRVALTDEDRRAVDAACERYEMILATRANATAARRRAA